MAKSAGPPGLARRRDDRMCLTMHQKEGDGNGQLGGREKNGQKCTTSETRTTKGWENDGREEAVIGEMYWLAIVTQKETSHCADLKNTM